MDRQTTECGESVVHGFHWKPALWSALVTSLIISWASVGFLAIMKMLSAHIKWFVSLPSSLYPIPWAFHSFITGCMVCSIPLLNSAGVRVPPWIPPWLKSKMIVGCSLLIVMFAGCSY